MATPGKEIAILIAGKTGNGKSATGNSILRKKAFTSSASMGHVTGKVKCDCSDLEGTNLKVVDTPGVENKDDSGEGIRSVVNAMAEAIIISPQGYHVILIVLQYGGRLTQEDIDAIKIFKRIFGDDFISVHSILLLTHGDDFKADKEDMGLTFEEWCGQQTGFFNQLYQECGQRVILFDNMTKDEEVKNEQVRLLIQMINRLTASGVPYTNEVFQKAKESRDFLMKDPVHVLVNENIMKELEDIIQLLENFSPSDPLDEKTRLEALHNRVKKVEDDIRKECKGSTSINAVMKLLQNVWKMHRLLESNLNSRIRQTEHDKAKEQIVKDLEAETRKISRREKEKISTTKRSGTKKETAVSSRKRRGLEADDKGAGVDVTILMKSTRENEEVEKVQGENTTEIVEMRAELNQMWAEVNKLRKERRPNIMERVVDTIFGLVGGDQD